VSFFFLFLLVIFCFCSIDSSPPAFQRYGPGVMNDIYTSRLTTIRIPGFPPHRNLVQRLVQKEVWMVTDNQVRRLMQQLGNQKPLVVAAAQAGMDEKTARKYQQLGQLPSQVRSPHTWRTRPDPFALVWDEVVTQLAAQPGLQAKTLFVDLQRRYPDQFNEGQLRTLQRRIKAWRAEYGPHKEVFFPQVHLPGQWGQSDFTHMEDLGITLAGQPFAHLFYHFVLPYSNWETGRICFSESFESLSAGLQQALWTLGGVPQGHQTDRLSAAVQRPHPRGIFTPHYEALLRHYGLEGRAIQAASPHENGDVEQRNYRFKQALDQALMLRGHRDFADQAAYGRFIQPLIDRLNGPRHERLAEEKTHLQPLPAQPLDACKRLLVNVGPSSTIRVSGQVYSVDSRLIGEKLDVRLYAERVEVWHGQRRVETLPRLRGRGQALIQYRHIIDWLVRKPGAFEQYRYRAALFPTSRFRMAYDALKQGAQPAQASKSYLHILHQAAQQGETRVDQALQHLLAQEPPLTLERIETYLSQAALVAFAPPVVHIDPVNLHAYDTLLEATR
jgi:hypothetical protein